MEKSSRMHDSTTWERMKVKATQTRPETTNTLQQPHYGGRARLRPMCSVKSLEHVHFNLFTAQGKCAQNFPYFSKLKSISATSFAIYAVVGCFSIEE